jgi:hypothetical protein
MNSILLAEPIQALRPVAAGRLLIVEPDGHRAGLLGRMLRPLTAIDLRIVPRVTDAIRAFTEAIPDLVMTTPLLAPSDETELLTQIRRTTGAAHVQVINLPHAIDTGRATTPHASRTSVFQFLRRSAGKEREACDASTLREEIEQYLARAVAVRDELKSRGLDAGRETVTAPSAVLTPNTTEMVLYGSKEVVDQRDRRRASRRVATDLPGLWTVRLPWGSDVKLVDISNSGVLFESPSKISPGVTVDLQIFGDQRNVFVPARMVRSEVSRVDALGVKYQMAAAFGRNVRLVDFDSEIGLSSPRVLTDLMARVLSDSEGLPTTADVARRFESELRRLLPRRDVQIRTTPAIAPRGAESIYFTLDQRADSPRIMQVSFEPGSAPSALEFRLLKTAASLASAAFEIAGLSEDTESRRFRLLA